ncbi:MAG: hypothetical protein ACJ742_17285, partial [Actinomycetes bacterium]
GPGRVGGGRRDRPVAPGRALACAWATLLGAPLIIAAWLAEAPHWYRQVGGLLLDADGGVVGCLSYSH